MAKLSDLITSKMRFTIPLWSNGEIIDVVEFYNPTKALTDEIEKKILAGEEISDEYKMTVLLEKLTNLEADIAPSDLLNGYYNEILDRILIEIDQIILDVSSNVLLRLKGFDEMTDDKREAIGHLTEGIDKNTIEEYIANTQKQIDIENENLEENVENIEEEI